MNDKHIPHTLLLFFPLSIFQHPSHSTIPYHSTFLSPISSNLLLIIFSLTRSGSLCRSHAVTLHCCLAFSLSHSSSTFLLSLYYSFLIITTTPPCVVWGLLYPLNIFNVLFVCECCWLSFSLLLSCYSPDAYTFLRVIIALDTSSSIHRHTEF